MKAAIFIVILISTLTVAAAGPALAQAVDLPSATISSDTDWTGLNPKETIRPGDIIFKTEYNPQCAGCGTAQLVIIYKDLTDNTLIINAGDPAARKEYRLELNVDQKAYLHVSPMTNNIILQLIDPFTGEVKLGIGKDRSVVTPLSIHPDML